MRMLKTKHLFLLFAGLAALAAGAAPVSSGGSAGPGVSTSPGGSATSVIPTASGIEFRTLSVDDGLSQSTVMTLAQDPLGRI